MLSTVALVSLDTDEREHRLALGMEMLQTAALVARPGLLNAPGHAVLTEVGALSATIGPFAAVVPGVDPNQGSYRVISTADEPIAISAGASDGDRVDLVVVRVYDAAWDESGLQSAAVEVIEGTPSADVLPSMPERPVGSILLYAVLVARDADAVDFEDEVVDMREATTGAGGVVRVRGWVARDRFVGAQAGQLLYRDDRRWHERWDGAAWRVLGIPAGASTFWLDSWVTDPYDRQVALVTATNRLVYWSESEQEWLQLVTDLVTGPEGDRGPVGLAGVQGQRGPRGEAGSQGETGLQGPPGIEGAQGPMGAQGFQGDEGLEGPQGPTGITGPVGPKGPQGPQGDEGPEGSAGTGTYGGPGGPGPTGAEGPEGPEGPAGGSGSQGPAGAAGADGPEGEAGSAGSAGSSGPRGPQGERGEAGEAGADGPGGPKGHQGSVGEAGAPGETGDSGPDCDTAGSGCAPKVDECRGPKALVILVGETMPGALARGVDGFAYVGIEFADLTGPGTVDAFYISATVSRHATARVNGSIQDDDIEEGGQFEFEGEEANDTDLAKAIIFGPFPPEKGFNKNFSKMNSIYTFISVSSSEREAEQEIIEQIAVFPLTSGGSFGGGSLMDGDDSSGIRSQTLSEPSGFYALVAAGISGVSAMPEGSTISFSGRADNGSGSTDAVRSRIVDGEGNEIALGSGVLEAGVGMRDFTIGPIGVPEGFPWSEASVSVRMESQRGSDAPVYRIADVQVGVQLGGGGDDDDPPELIEPVLSDAKVCVDYVELEDVPPPPDDPRDLRCVWRVTNDGIG